MEQADFDTIITSAEDLAGWIDPEQQPQEWEVVGVGVPALAAEIERLREHLRDRSAYLDWLVNEVCPGHNVDCVQVGCPATPPGWQPAP